MELALTLYVAVGLGGSGMPTGSVWTIVALKKAAGGLVWVAMEVVMVHCVSICVLASSRTATRMGEKQQLP